MHNIEPFYNWQHIYIASEDERSPFYGREYNELGYSQAIYNYFIHPQWDCFDSNTLYLKILYTDYDTGYAIIEMIGEWNDCINNDIMYLKREVIDLMLGEGINKFIMIGENVLNFHASDDDYYEEWREEIAADGGWIVFMNFRDHVIKEMESIKLSNYVYYNQEGQYVNWRNYQPEHLFQLIGKVLERPALEEG